MRGLKLSLIYLGAILVVIALQLFVVTGIFLMMFGAALWPAVLFNVWMVHLGVTALRNKSERAWLAVPVAVYVVYGALALNGYREALVLKASIAQAAHVDPAALPHGLKAIQFPEQRGYFDNDAIAYAQIEGGFDVYAGARNYHRTDASDPACRMRGPDDEPRPHGFFPADMTKETGFGGGRHWEYCIVSRLATPPADAIHILRQEAPHAAAAIAWTNLGWARIGISPGGFAPTARLDTATFLVNARPIGQARTGTIDYPWPVPAFIAGCFLDDANNSWDCMFGLAHETMTVGKVDGLGSFYDAAARAAYLAGVLHLPVRNLKGK